MSNHFSPFSEFPHVQVVLKLKQARFVQCLIDTSGSLVLLGPPHMRNCGRTYIPRCGRCEHKVGGLWDISDLIGTDTGFMKLSKLVPENRSRLWPVQSRGRFCSDYG